VNAFAQPSSAPVAGPQLDNRRVLAAIVDLLVIFAGSFVLGAIFGMINGADAEWGPQMQAITVAWALYYYFAFESGAGQTLGKKLLKIRVIRADGGPAGMREIAIRTVLRIIDGLFLYLVGLIIMLVTGQRRQRLGDIAAGTVVADASTSPAPHASPATAAPPAAATPEGLDVPERPADAEPRESTPVDVGTPIAGLTPPQPSPRPEVTDFEPFSQPADETESADEQEAFDQPDSFDQPDAFDQPDGVDQPESFDQPGHDFDVPDSSVAQPEAFEPPTDSFDEPESSVDEPEAFEGPDSFDEPRPTDEPQPFESTEPEERAVPAGSTEWPHMYASRAYEAEMALSPQPQEPHVGDSPDPEPVEDLQADAARAVEEPASDPESDVPGLPGSPVEEPRAEEPAQVTDEHADEPAAAADAPEDAPASDDDVRVKPIETVSAIDLVMGGDEQDEADSSPTESSGDEPETGEDRPAGV
jgi:uncharacterized RDD family membrane protein YckC